MAAALHEPVVLSHLGSFMRFHAKMVGSFP